MGFCIRADSLLLLLVTLQETDAFDTGEAFLGNGEGGFDVACAGLVDHLIVHVDVVEEIVLASFAIDGVVEDMDGDGFGEFDGGRLVGGEDFLDA